MLYIFAGFPKSGLHAGGIQFAVEEVEELALLEHDPNVQYRKEGVFTPGEKGEFLYPIEYVMSSNCLRAGITWDWFPENWSFGNGVTVHKTWASPEYKTVVHKRITGTRAIANRLFRRPVGLVSTHLTVAEILAAGESVDYSKITLKAVHIRTEGWEEYEVRWLPGTCPQKAHIVHLTWLVTTHRLPAFAYEMTRQLIENPTGWLGYPERYSQEPGKHFSAIRKWDGKPAHHAGVAS